MVLEIGDQQAQVARGRLAAGDDRRQVAIDLDLHRVDDLFLLEHVAGDVAAEGAQGLDGLRDLRFHEAAHLQHARGDAAQLGVELGGEMLVGHVVAPR